MDTVKITYIGHACFALEYEGSRIILDPYRGGMVPGLSDMAEKADFVYCSHLHDDHGWTEAVELSGEDCANFGLGELTVPHDEADGSKRGWNTVRIFSFGSLRVAHMGDIGRVLTGEEAEILKGVDCMMLPIGGFFTVGAEEAKTIYEQVAPRVLIPMHYSGPGYGFEQIACAEDFVDIVDEASVRYGGDSFTLSADTPSQIRVMRPKMLNVGVGDASREFHSQGYNCCQCVIRALSEKMGLGLENANLGYGFGGGMHMKSVCGALTGGLMALGSACLDPERPNPSRPDANELSVELERRFNEKIGTVLCSDIVEKYEKSRCGELIAFAAENALEIIEEYKNK